MGTMVAVPVGVRVGVHVQVSVDVNVDVGVAVGATVTVVVAVAVWLGVPVRLSVPVWLGVLDGVRVGVTEAIHGIEHTKKRTITTGNGETIRCCLISANKKLSGNDDEHSAEGQEHRRAGSR